MMKDDLLDDVWIDDDIIDETDSKPISPSDYRRAFIANSEEKNKFPGNLSFLRRATSSFIEKYDHRVIQTSTIREVNLVKNRNAIRIATYINRCTYIWSLILKDMELSYRRCTMYKNRRKARERVRQHIKDLQYCLKSIHQLTPETCTGGAGEILSLKYNQKIWIELMDEKARDCPPLPELTMMYYQHATFECMSQHRFRRLVLWRDEMIDAAMEDCFRATPNFDIETTPNPFNYFRTVIRLQFGKLIQSKVEEINAKKEMLERIKKVSHMPDETDYRLVYSKDVL